MDVEHFIEDHGCGNHWKFNGFTSDVHSVQLVAVQEFKSGKFVSSRAIFVSGF